MWRSLLAIALLLGSISASSVTSPLSVSDEKFDLFLPLITFSPPSPPPIEVVVTARGENIGYPTYYYIYGYVRNLIDEPLYSVTVEVDVTIYPYYPLLDPSDNDETVQVSPALTATLPGQINPFYYDLLLGKASAIIGGARPGAASLTAPGGDTYYPLTVVSWEYADGTLSGIVRNDSDQPLQDARLGVVELEKCTWREAELAVTTLQPGQETTFQLNFSEYCLDSSLEIVGQGAAQP